MASEVFWHNNGHLFDDCDSSCLRAFRRLLYSFGQHGGGHVPRTTASTCGFSQFIGGRFAAFFFGFAFIPSPSAARRR